jgi:hypothetical protein
MTPITVKLWNAAKLDPVLPSLLLSNSLIGNQAQFNGTFRWYDLQLRQFSPYPAVTNRVISSVPFQGQQRNPISKVRVELTLWEGQVRDYQGLLLQAVMNFLDTFTASQSVSRPLVIQDGTDGFYAQTDPGIYQRIVEAFIFNNTTT